MTKVSRVKKQKRQAEYRKTQAFNKALAVCRNCGEKGPHFLPPSFGDPGSYICYKPGQTLGEKLEEYRLAVKAHRANYPSRRFIFDEAYVGLDIDKLTAMELPNK